MNKQKLKEITSLAIAAMLLCICVFALCGCKTGSKWIYGESDPVSSQGRNGDYYLDTKGNVIYQKINGEWQTIYKPTDYKNTSIVLPDILYACVGQNIEIYFRNIMAYSLDEVCISTGTNIPDSKQLADKWTATPREAGLYVLVIAIYSKDWELISSKRVDFIVKETTSSTSIKALAVGDSTLCTGGETGKMLELARADDKVNLSLIGTTRFGDEGNVCEGRSGWRASNYTSLAAINNVVNPFFNPSSQTFDFTYYMQQQGYDGVDVVFIQLGINDIFHTLSEIDSAIETYLTSMDKIITSIHSYDSNVKVVINMIIPCCQDQTKFGEVYGVRTVWEYMRKIYSANLALLDKFGGANNVYLSYYNASLDAVANQPNDVHPSAEGYSQLGYQMYYYMKAIMS